MWYHLYHLIRNLITFIYHIFLICFINVIILKLFNQNIHLNNLNLFSFTHAFTFNIVSSFYRNIQTHLFITHFYLHMLAFNRHLLLIHILKERRFLITHVINIQNFFVTDIISFFSATNQNH